MTGDIYERVAERLNSMPHGFPSTEDGLEIEILRKMFPNPMDAERWMKFNRKPEPVEILAERFGVSISIMQDIVDDMVGKGLIRPIIIDGKGVYRVEPFVIGTYEMVIQSGHLDEELARLFEEYFPYLADGYGSVPPSEARVVPINANIRAESVVNSYEDACKIVESGQTFRVAPCVCRVERKMIGEPCPKNHSTNTCLHIGMEDGAFTRYTLPGAKVITKEEALEIVKKCEEEGLVHMSYNIKSAHRFICNCCSCCCLGLRGAKEFKAPYMMLKSNYVAQIDAESCTSCGTCDERCPMDAIAEEDDGYKVLSEHCIGCGVCTTSCPTEAIYLEIRPQSERTEPLESLSEWQVKRAASRGIKPMIE